MNDQSDLTVSRFSGAALMAVGGLMTALCGSCTLFFLGVAAVGTITGMQPSSSLSDSDRYSAAFAPIVAVGAIIVGVLPTAFGVVVFIAGRKRYLRTALGAKRWPLSTGGSPPDE